MVELVLLAAFRRTLEDVFVLGDQDPVLVAFSGGLDSVALLDVAVTCLGARRVIAAHVDHATRSESAAEAELVASIAAGLGCPFELRRLPPGPTDEDRLRGLRYAALEEMRSGRGASAILIAHTRDDQAETVLIDLIRGGGGAELRGMPKVRDRIVRPFLDVSRAEVHDYVRAKKLRFVQDPSNLEPRYLRSRIRKELLPLLESRYRPRLSERLAERVAARRNPSEPGTPTRNPTPSPAVQNEDGPSIEIGFEWREAPVPLPRDLWSCVLDARLVPRPLVRGPRPGDRIGLFGHGGHKKLQDVFVDAKVPRARRKTYSVVAFGDQIVWVPGLARAPIGLVGPETGPVWVLTARI